MIDIINGFLLLNGARQLSFDNMRSSVEATFALVDWLVILFLAISGFLRGIMVCPRFVVALVIGSGVRVAAGIDSMVGAGNFTARVAIISR